MHASSLIRSRFGRALLHLTALFSVPALLRVLDLRPARKVAVFYCGIVLLGFVATAGITALARQRWIAAPARILYLSSSALLLLVATIHADNSLFYGELIADTAGAIFQTSLLEATLYIVPDITRHNGQVCR